LLPKALKIITSLYILALIVIVINHLCKNFAIHSLRLVISYLCSNLINCKLLYLYYCIFIFSVLYCYCWLVGPIAYCKYNCKSAVIS